VSVRPGRLHGFRTAAATVLAASLMAGVAAEALPATTAHGGVVTDAAATAETNDGASVAEASLQPQARTRYVALGDSLAFGLWDWRGGYVDRLVRIREEAGESIRLDNRGVPGAHTTDLLASLRERPVRRAVRRADVISVSIGGNDLRDVRAAYQQSCLDPRPLAEALQRRTMRVYRILLRLNPDARILTMNYYNPYVRQDRSRNSCPDSGSDFRVLNRVGVSVNRDLRRGLRERSETIGVANVYRVFNVKKRNGTRSVVDPRVKDLLSIDGLHPNRDGHARIAKRHARLW
jgi:lysophospholipase L1-like esterase